MSASLATLAAGIALLPWALAPRSLEVVALDVGHGTSVVLRAPGSGALVFDAGSRERRRVAHEALLPLLARWEVSALDVVLSHDDRDHASGLARLVERYPPRLWAGALPAEIEARLPESCRRLDTGTGEVRWRSGARLELALLRGAEGRDNEGSRTLWANAGDGAVVLCGDAEDEGLAGLLRRNALAGPVRLLLFPHHGSDTPWLAALLEQARPDQVWISGPKPALAAELDRRGQRWSSTGSAGCLELRRAAPLDPRRASWRELPIRAFFPLPRDAGAEESAREERS